jgi:membrane protein DedA with SNARE-associated domain
MSFPAGAVKMPLSKFVACTATGCLVWDTILIYGGLVLGTSWQQMTGISNYLIVVTVAVISAAVAAFFVKRKKTKAIAENRKKHV